MSALITRVLFSTAMLAAFSGSAKAQDDLDQLRRFETDGTDSAQAIRNPRDLLTLIESPAGSGAATTGRLRHYNFSGADIGLTFDLTRLSSKYRPEPGVGSDRYGITQVGVSGRIPVSDRFDMLMVGDLAYLRQYLTTVPTSYDKGQTYAARAGLGLAGGNWSITALYETVTGKSRNGSMHRMAELLGGAPFNRDDLSLAIQSDFAVNSRSRLGVSLIGKTMRGSSRDLALIGAAGNARPEAQAVFRATLTF